MYSLNQAPGKGAENRTSSRSAFVTFLTRNDSYLPGALLLGYRLREMGVDADTVCLITQRLSARAARSLRLIFDHVVTVDEIYVPHDHTHGRPGVPYMFTRINALRLGPDGDLGFAYKKVVVLDADVLPVARYDDLLRLVVPAGVMNERKEHVVPVRERRGHVRRTWTGRDGLTRWHWHEIYEKTCAQGKQIPKELTDRVLSDEKNMGINGALLVLEPSMAEFHAIAEDLQRDDTKAKVSRAYMWPDMQYLTGRWSGRWHSVDVRYASLNGYPHPRHVFGIHFAGIKPWSINHRSFAHYSRFEDFKLWRCRFNEMLSSVPRVSSDRRLMGLGRVLSEGRAA